MRASQRQSNGFKEKVFDHGRRLWSNKFRLKELHIGRRREIAAERNPRGILLEPGSGPCSLLLHSLLTLPNFTSSAIFLKKALKFP